MAHLEQCSGDSMAYDLEALGDERFQQLCQSLLVCTFPNVQCFPVGQPDGGRDAVSQSTDASSGGFIVFQVKFSRRPESRDARDFIEQVIKSEIPKIKRLKSRGATEYYILTNISGTGHFGTGSIDKVDAELSGVLGIKCHCWWRDDIERRIDVFPNSKWSYPEIIKSTDLLQILLDRESDENSKRRTAALRSYMAYQAKYDAKLKFKQIDLHKSVVDLFVDVPARLTPRRTHGKEEFLFQSELDDELAKDAVFPPLVEMDDLGEEQLRSAPGMLQLLAQAKFAREFPRIVIEGAPGQGKSTVTQYLCQVHRLILLNREQELSRTTPAHRPNEARIPFRVDVRDYASWIAGRDPFSDDPAARPPAHSSPILESFLAAQVQRCTGMSFSVEDLAAVAEKSQILIVLDGFDEVADTGLRERIVTEVSDAATRILESALSAQLVVTSRPAAFANSPGFPREEWQHAHLLSLSRAAIEAYAGRWLDGRDADARERGDILRVLGDKLGQAHVRDLARNPMQLAILLALISVQGASLPDKRTALYDNYIEIFLNRESEKSIIVRDHRELLVHIHRYLAWMLQVEAESNSGVGHITEARLRETVRIFLERGGHPTTLLDALFTGMVERVVALVSRIQGTFEFEVQPLREYFAARYLYDTAPYSPPSKPRSGTLPDRFDAIARNFYWLNVVRFYSGCYSSGELASLLAGLEELDSADQFKFISHVSQLGATLLSDYVFGQQPKLATKLATRITSFTRLRILLAHRMLDHPRNGLRLPSGPPRVELVNACVAALSTYRQFDTLYALSETLRENCSVEELKYIWYKLKDKLGDDIVLIRLCSLFGIIERLSVQECVELIDKYHLQSAIELVRNNRSDALDERPQAWNDVVSAILNGERAFYYIIRNSESTSPKVEMLVAISAIFESQIHFNHDVGRNLSLRLMISNQYVRRSADVSLSSVVDRCSDSELLAPRAFFNQLAAFLEERIDVLRRNISAWSELIESCRAIWGDRWAIYGGAVAAVELVQENAAVECELLDSEVPLCTRFAFARTATNSANWWRQQLRQARGRSDLEVGLVVLAVNRWMPVKAILESSEEVSALLEGLSDGHWRALCAVGWQGAPAGFSIGEKKKREKFSNSLPPKMSPRLASLLIARVPRHIGRRIFDNYLINDVGEDRQVLSAMVNFLISGARRRPDHWSDALPLIKRAYKLGISPTRVWRGDKSDKDIPVPEARRICASAECYPLSLVGEAESVLAAQTGAAAIPVGKIAARDEWFSED